MRIIAGKNEGDRSRALRGLLVLVLVFGMTAGPKIAAAGPFEDPTRTPPPGEAISGSSSSRSTPTAGGPASDVPDAAEDLVSEVLSPSPSPTPEPTPDATPRPEERTEPADEDGHPTSGDEDSAEDAVTPDPVSEPIPDIELPLELSWLPTGKRSTTDLLRRFDELDLPDDAARRILAPFPVFGPARYSDDWHAPRPGGRLHEGIDVFAPRGTPVIASTDGVLTQVRDGSPRAGKSIRLTELDGTYSFYAHLEAFHPDVERGARVSRGDVLGYVGTTGNAQGTMPHLHFEIHPRGGEAVPPADHLDRWLEQAREAVGFFTTVRSVLVALPDAHFEELTRSASTSRTRTGATELGITRARVDEAPPSDSGPPGPFTLLAAGALGFPFVRRLTNARGVCRRIRDEIR